MSASYKSQQNHAYTAQFTQIYIKADSRNFQTCIVRNFYPQNHPGFDFQ